MISLFQDLQNKMEICVAIWLMRRRIEENNGEFFLAGYEKEAGYDHMRRRDRRN